MICRTCNRDTVHVREDLGPNAEWICRPCNFSPLKIDRRRGDRRLKPRARPGRRIEDLTSYDEIIAAMDAAFGPDL